MTNDELLQSALMKHRDGEFDAAMKLYAQVLQNEPGQPTASLNMASIAMDKGLVDDAAELVKRVLAQDEDNGVAHLLYSRICFLRGRHDEGYPHVRAAFELLPDDEGVGAELVSALRRQYFTFSQDEYLQKFELAQQGELPTEDMQRLAHLTFLRILRPELIRLLVEPGLPQDTPVALTRWLATLPEEAQADLVLLARNFVQALELMQQQSEFAPQPARLYLRVLPEESLAPEQMASEVEDVDTLTGATLEVMVDGVLRFIPFSSIATIEFNEPAAVTGVVITDREGNTFSGLMPLFYLFTEFAEAENVRQGRSTLIRPLLPDIAVGVGLRALRVDGKPLPIVRVEKIEFMQ